MYNNINVKNIDNNITLPILDNVEILYGDCSIEVVTNHLLTISSHHALARSEVFWCEDCRSNDERYVRSIYVASLKVAAALIANKNLVAWEVGVLVDCEAVAQCTDLLSAKTKWCLNLTVAIKAD